MMCLYSQREGKTVSKQCAVEICRNDAQTRWVLRGPAGEAIDTLDLCDSHSGGEADALSGWDEEPIEGATSALVG